MKALSLKLCQLTSILSDLSYHDGDSIGKQLGITRSAVWKYIKKLQEYGVEVSSIKNKGYALKEPLLALDKEFICKEIDNPNISVETLESVDSTNSYLRKNLKDNQRQICISEMQTSGRGRMSRLWHSPFGKNIYMSYAYYFKKDISSLTGLSLVVSMAMLSAIKEIIPNIDIKLKWPNDGMHNDCKLMGNLINLQAEANGSSVAIMGIGINVNMKHASEISQKWESLQSISNSYINRNSLCVALIHNLNAYLERFSKYGLRDFVIEWKNLDYLYNKDIYLNNGEVTGIAKGINEQGNLLIKLNNGELKSFSCGDTSVRKL